MLDTVATLSQILGAVGVIGSLIFVGMQIMENSKAVRSATAQAVHDNYAGWYIALMGNEKALATSTKGFVNLALLSPEERHNLSAPTWRSFRIRRMRFTSGRRDILRTVCGLVGRR